MLAGNGVHFDLSFLRVHAPSACKRLNYRVINVSTFRDALALWGLPPAPKAERTHRAKSDVLISIAQLKHFRSLIPGAA